MIMSAIKLHREVKRARSISEISKKVLEDQIEKDDLLNERLEQVRSQEEKMEHCIIVRENVRSSFVKDLMNVERDMRNDNNNLIGKRKRESTIQRFISAFSLDNRVLN